LPPECQALRFAHAFGGEKVATIVAPNGLAGPIEAAIVNGVPAQSDETDDNYSAGGAYPGWAVVPAALALGEIFGIDGKHFLHAVTLGYNIGMRAMKTRRSRTVLKDTHNVVGTFGPGGGRRCKLNAEQMCAGCSTAAQQAGPVSRSGNAIPSIWRRPSCSGRWEIICVAG
jgi:2-methylcitrate dehydratase PrpD